MTYFDLVEGSSVTFPFEMPNAISHLAISPNGILLLAIDIKGQSVLVNIPQRFVLHWVNFHEPVSALAFSPDGTKLAMAIGLRLRIWSTPALRREFSPFNLEKTISGHSNDIVSIDWSRDSRYILTASKDMSARIVDLKKDSLNPTFRPTELRAHHHPLVSAFFLPSENGVADDAHILTVAKNGGIALWPFDSQKGTVPGVGPIFRDSLIQTMKEADREGNVSEDDDEDDKQKAREGAIKENEGEKGAFLMRKEFRSKIVSITFEKDHGLLAVGFSSGIFSIFLLLQQPSLQHLYSLSLTQSRISTMSLNATGEWLALGVSEIGQLIVWEWRTESFILKQQGHVAPMSCLAYSPDGQTMATGSADGKVKLWSGYSGLCFVTFGDHLAAVNAIEFTKNGKVVVSASADGTIRAFDLLRYRNFRIMTTPTPVQFLSLAVDPSGEIVAAGTLDTFEIYLWSMQTGQLLEVLSGHTGPVSALAFDPVGHILASASWDKSVRLWEVFNRDKNTQVLDHSSDVLALAFRSDGQQVAAATLRGEIYIWDVQLAQVSTILDARRDIADKPLSPAAIKSISYSADDELLLIGGKFPFIGIFNVQTRVLLQRYPLKKMRWGDRKKETEGEEFTTHCVRTSPTGRAFAVLTDEGLVIFSRDETLFFDPLDLEMEVTPQKTAELLQGGEYLRSFIMALRLNIPSLTEQIFEAIPADHIALVTRSIPKKYLLSCIAFFGKLIGQTIHAERAVRWVQALFQEHALTIRQERDKYAAALRLLHGNIQLMYEGIAKKADGCMHMLDVAIDRIKAQQLTEEMQQVQIQDSTVDN